MEAISIEGRRSRQPQATQWGRWDYSGDWGEKDRKKKKEK
jgi:hypothetical protein